MCAKFKVVDLFAGPGGLAEGFASVRDENGQQIFDIVLSVEKEPSAFATLRLRSFFRQFNQAPPAYYDYIAGRISKEEMIEAHPSEWQSAITETMMLELGTEEAVAALDPILDTLREGPDQTVLIGGPPCQAYSLVGRSRNMGIKDYDPAKDSRHFLYKEYIRIIERLQPAAFVMENVKGILSAKVDGEGIFDRVLADLKGAGGDPDSYLLVPLVMGGKGRGTGFVIRCEEYGIPQSRHRVIVVGIRKDLAAKAESTIGIGLLQPFVTQATVSSVLEGMPALRSGLSRERDTFEAWRDVACEALRKAAKASRSTVVWLGEVANLLDAQAENLAARTDRLDRRSKSITAPKDNRLGSWLSDPLMDTLPNHESRGHMREDLARYAFVAAFGEVFGRSPKAGEFPKGLAPEHGNWATGKFADRFRVQLWNRPSTTVTSHISKDGHYFIHPDPGQCRSLTVREAARLQTFPDNYFFEGNRTQQFVQVGNAVPPLLAQQISFIINSLI